MHVSEADQCAHEKFKKVLHLIEYVEEEFNLFDVYPECEHALDTKIISVHPKYGGIGIGKNLMLKTIECARENNAQLSHIMCSSHFSARLCEKLGFAKLYELPYVDYSKVGRFQMLPAEPHSSLKVLVQKLQK